MIDNSNLINDPLNSLDPSTKDTSCGKSVNGFVSKRGMVTQKFTQPSMILWGWVMSIIVCQVIFEASPLQQVVRYGDGRLVLVTKKGIGKRPKTKLIRILWKKLRMKQQQTLRRIGRNLEKKLGMLPFHF